MAALVSASATPTAAHAQTAAPAAQPAARAPAHTPETPAGYQPVYVPTNGPDGKPAYYPQAQGVAISGPAEISSYEDGAPIPIGYHPVSRMRTGLVVGGAVTFGTMYFITALVAAGNADANKGGTNPAAALWLPGVGPFIQMGNTDSSIAGVFLAIDGITQLAGLTMLVVGLTSPKTVLVRNDLGKIQLRPVPLAGRGITGFGLGGTF